MTDQKKKEIAKQSCLYLLNAAIYIVVALQCMVYFSAISFIIVVPYFFIIMALRTKNKLIVPTSRYSAFLMSANKTVKRLKKRLKRSTVRRKKLESELQLAKYALTQISEYDVHHGHGQIGTDCMYQDCKGIARRALEDMKG